MAGRPDTTGAEVVPAGQLCTSGPAVPSEATGPLRPRLHRVNRPGSPGRDHRPIKRPTASAGQHRAAATFMIAVASTVSGSYQPAIIAAMLIAFGSFLLLALVEQKRSARELVDIRAPQ